VTISCGAIESAERKLIHSSLTGLQKSKVTISAKQPIDKDHPVEDFVVKFDREDYESFCFYFTLGMNSHTGVSREQWDLLIPLDLRRDLKPYL
jgi:hypothetical protein